MKICFKPRGERGSLTIFFSLALPVLVLFLGIMLDITRMKAASNILEEGLYGGLDSTLANYNKELRQEYGLFAVSSSEAEIFKDVLFYDLQDSVEIMNSEITYLDSLSEQNILKDQILEEMKITGLVNIGKDFLNQLKNFQNLGMSENLEGLGGSKEEVSQSVQEDVAKNVKNIKALEERQKAGEEGLEEEIKGLYEENKDLVILAEDVANGDYGDEFGEKEENEKGWAESLGRLEEAYGKDIFSKGDQVDDFLQNKEKITKTENILETGLLGIRDNLLLDEYILEHFENMSGLGAGEVEEIMYGDNYVVKTILEVFLWRLTLDGIGYFVLDPKSPPEPVSRLIYSAVAGGVTAIYDTAGMLLEKDFSVPLIHIEPQGFTPLEKIEFSYRNQLQLMLLLKSEEEKLEGVYKKIAEEYGSGLYTGIKGSATCRQKIIFLSFLPDGTKILDGYVEGGYFYVSKELTKSY